MDVKDILMIVGIFVSVLFSGGSLWKILDFARWAGTQDEKHKSHERRLAALEKYR